MANWKKIIGYTTIATIFVGATSGILYLINDSRKRAQTPPVKSEKEDISSANTNGCIYPLKKGDGFKDCVKPLQEALNVKIDGYFGQVTEAALKEQAQKTQIDSYADLLKTIDYIKKRNDLLINSDRSQQMLNTYKNFKNIQSMYDQTWQGQDAGTDVENKYFLKVVRGAMINLEDYKPIGVLKNGKLLVYCDKGSNKGYWSIDSNKISLLK